jgi:hypothetical protein
MNPANAASTISDGTVWPLQWLTPEQAQHVFAECKRDRVNFKTDTALVYRFCDALLSANVNNPLWVSIHPFHRLRPLLIFRSFD